MDLGGSWHEVLGTDDVCMVGGTLVLLVLQDRKKTT